MTAILIDLRTRTRVRFMYLIRVRRRIRLSSSVPGMYKAMLFMILWIRHRREKMNSDALLEEGKPWTTYSRLISREQGNEWRDRRKASEEGGRMVSKLTEHLLVRPGNGFVLVPPASRSEGYVEAQDEGEWNHVDESGAHDHHLLVPSESRLRRECGRQKRTRERCGSDIRISDVWCQ